MKDTVALGAIGITSTWGTVAATLYSHAVSAAQFLSIIVGLIIGCWTLWRMWRYPPKKNDDE